MERTGRTKRAMKPSCLSFYTHVSIIVTVITRCVVNITVVLINHMTHVVVFLKFFRYLAIKLINYKLINWGADPGSV